MFLVFPITGDKILAKIGGEYREHCSDTAMPDSCLIAASKPSFKDFPNKPKRRCGSVTELQQRHESVISSDTFFSQSCFCHNECGIIKLPFPFG